MKEYKKLGTLFGDEFYIKTDSEEAFKASENWLADLEARERRVRTKEIELDLQLIN